jgi:multicomponent Na+:H+ antiporter subunit D
MRCAMSLFAFLCIALGIWPESLYDMLPYPVQYQSYTAAHVLTQLQLLLFSGLAFFLMLGYLRRTPTVTLDFDWLWRVLLPRVCHRVEVLITRVNARLTRAVSHVLRRVAGGIARQREPHGLLLRSWPTGSMTMWVMVMLLGYLLLYYTS